MHRVVICYTFTLKPYKMTPVHYFIGIFGNISPQQKLPALPKEADEMWKPFSSDNRIKCHIVENIDYNRIADNFDAVMVQNALIVHYGGHSNPTDVVMADGNFPMLNILNQSGVNYAKLKLVFLNSCEALEQADVLLEKGAQMVIASPKTVGDEDAKLFAVHFYMALAKGFSVKTAYQKALQYLNDQKKLNPSEQIVQRNGVPVSKRQNYKPAPIYWWTLCYKEEAVINEKLEDWLPKMSQFPKDLTTLIPRIEDPAKIIGRGKDLENLRQVLTQKQRAVVVNGLGGIGKTTLAQAYLTQYAGEYAHILWLTQSEGDNLALDLLTAPGLTQNLRINTDGKDVQALFIEILSTLKSITDQPNLWVIDNANATLQNYFDYLPQPPNWHILVTSREKIERFEPINLDFLHPDDALQLFYTHCQRLTDETALKQLLKTIDYHTLTIEILAKAAQRNDTPLTTLQQAIEKDLKTGVYTRHSTDKIERVTSYLLSIFELHNLSPQEQNLLQHFSALPTEYIPYEWLKALIPADEEGIAPTLQDLTDKGWLLYQPQPESYKMHRIIQEVVKRKIPPTVAGLQGLIEKVTRLVSIDQTKDNPVHKFPFIPFGEAVLSLFPHETDITISRLQGELALRFQYLGNYTTAKTLFQKVMKSDEANFGPKHPATAVRYSNLGLVLQALGDYAGAKTLLQKAMMSMKANFGKNHPSTAITYSNLAGVLADLKEYEQALCLEFKAFNILSTHFEENNPHHQQAKNNLNGMIHLMLQNGYTIEAIQKLVQNCK